MCTIVLCTRFVACLLLKHTACLCAETQGNRYQACLDDIGARICCQWQPEQGLPSGFAEIGPLALDPTFAAEAETQKTGTARFRVQSKEQVHTCCLAQVWEREMSLNLVIETIPIVIPRAHESLAPSLM